MAMLPTAECAAASVNVNVESEVVAEEVTTEVATEEVTTEVATEEVTTEVATEEVTTEVVTEEVTTEVATEEVTTEVVTEEVTTEVVTEEVTTEEVTTEVVTEEVTTEVATEEATTEVETEEVTTEAETEEVTTEAETEVSLPGMDNYTLSAEDKAELKVLKDNMSFIQNVKEGEECVKGELVFLADTQEEALAIAAGYGAELEGYEYGVAVIKLAEDVSIADALSMAANQTEDVVLAPAWPNYYRTTCSGTDSYISIEADADMLDMGTADVEIGMSSVDPYLLATSGSYQWQHNMVGSQAAWNAGYTGKGVKVAVIDSGVLSTHEDLNVIDNKSFVTGNSSPNDGVGHGTHVAGLVAAKKGNGKGGAGIAPDAEILNLRVLGDDGSGEDYDIMRAVSYAAQNGVDIINMSLGGPGYSKSFQTVVKSAYESGVLVLAAAGNESTSAKAYPAGYDYVYSIGAVRQNKGKTYFTNYGSWVDFSAPGEDLYSTYNAGTSSYTAMSGTSMACPVAAGTAAVILSANPGIMSKTGKDKVKALVSAMNKGKVAGNGGASNIVDLRKALGVKEAYEAPMAPTFEVASNTKIEEEKMMLTINKSASTDTIYYSLDGKNVTFKNGAPSANAFVYTGPVEIGGAAKITVKAIAVNPVGIASKASTATYKFAPKVSSIELSGVTTILAGKSTKLTATVAPSYAANKKVTWTVSPAEKGVTVKNGTVKAAKTAEAGKYTITATSANNISKSIVINVTDKSNVKSIKFTPAKATVEIGAKSTTYSVADKIAVTLTDGSTTANISDIAWSTNNANVATVNAGEITAKAAGTAKITAMAADGSGKKAVFTITVKQKATGIKITGYDKLAVGKSIKLAATVIPATTANKKVVWSVSPEGQGVTVKNGVVKAAKNAAAANYKITATSADGSEATDSMTVVVSDNAITKITLDQKNATIFRTAGNSKAATSVTVKATVQSKAANTAVEFISSNPGIATVTQSGATAVITATGKATGTTKITCKAMDGSGKSATCTVTVQNPASKLVINPNSGYSFNVAQGAKIKLNAVFESANGPIKAGKVEWTSSDESAVTVDKNGNVKGIKAFSTAVITARATDGSNLSASCTISVWNKYNKFETYPNLNSKNYYINVTDGTKGLPILFDGQQNTNVGAFVAMAVEVSNPDVLNAYVYSDYYGNMYLVITPNKKGTSKITIKSIDGTNKKVTYSLQVR